MEIARSTGINWIWYIHFNVLDKDTVIINKEYRVHRDEEEHPEITIREEYRLEQEDSDVPILVIGPYSITRKEYLVLKPKLE